MKKWIEWMKRNWVINTSKVILLILILVTLFIVLNITVQKLNLPSIDVTKEKLYSLSEESKQKVKDINDDIKIYFFGIEENTSIVDLAKQYTRVNAKIQAEVINVSDRPDLAQKYGVSEEDQGIIVQASLRNKVLSLSDLSSYDYTTGTSIDMTEQKLTNAIIDTTLVEKPKVYFLTGHKETNNFIMFTTFLENEVNQVASLNILSSGIPEDCDCLVISSPETDFTVFEADTIINYIQKGGNILWLNDSISSDLPNVQKVLDQYGVKISTGTVRESDTNRMILNNPSYILPSMSYHNITQHIVTDGAVLFLDSTKLEIAQDDTLTSLNVTSSPILQSSNTSFFRTDATLSSSKATDNEENGPFTLGAELVKTVNNETTSKLIIYANSKFATDTTVANQQQSAFALLYNKDLLLNSVSYLTNREDTITIRKDTGSVTYTATANQDTIIRIIIFSVPIVIILIGIVVWQIRRRKK